MKFLQSSSIGQKILIRIVLVALAPLILIAIVVVVGVNQLNSTAAERVEENRTVLEEESVLVNSETQAVSVGREINLTLVERMLDVQQWARSSVIIDGANAAAEFADEEQLPELTIDELETRFERLKSTQQAPGAQRFLVQELDRNDDFKEIFFTDSNGYVTAVTDTTSDFVQSDEDWWQEAWSSGLSISDVEFDESAGVFSVDIAVRIDDTLRVRKAGVLKASLSIDFVQVIATQQAVGQVNHTVALADGRLLAETSTEHESERMLNSELSIDGSVEAVLGSTGSGAAVDGDIIYGYTQLIDPDAFLKVSAGFDGFDWYVVSSQPTEVALAPLRGLEELSNDIDQSGRNLQTALLVVLLLGFVLAFVIGRIMARGITGPISALTIAASDAAESGLPQTVDKINVDGADPESISAPQLELNTGDELEDLAASFNSVQATAIRLAGEQAAARRKTSEMFVNLGRRNQSLLKRQLRFIDDLERDEADPDTLESLFKLDHLATRMRRNAESLLVLAGDQTPRRWTEPVPIIAAVQASLAEVENYERVNLVELWDGQVAGNAVADVTHIMAELIENALNFSPPDAEVSVTGRGGPDGKHILKVIDEGIGMSQIEMDDANERLASSHELSEVPAQYLGLFVVSRLAARHDIVVALEAGENGGVTAKVELPRTLTRTEDKPKGGRPAAKSGKGRGKRKSKAKPSTDQKPEASATGSKSESESGTESESDAVRVHAIDKQESVAPAAKTGGGDRRSKKGRRGDDVEPEEMLEADESDPGKVTVGDFEFPRRGAAEPEEEKTEKSGRRASDKEESTPSADDLEAYGFTRRSDKEPAAAKKKTPVSASVGKMASKDEQEPEELAEKTKDRWSKFQKGKEEAQTSES